MDSILPVGNPTGLRPLLDPVAKVMFGKHWPKGLHRDQVLLDSKTFHGSGWYFTLLRVGAEGFEQCWTKKKKKVPELSVSKDRGKQNTTPQQNNKLQPTIRSKISS